MVIFLVHASTVVLLTRIGDLGWGRCSVFGLLFVSMTALYENVIAA